MTRKSEEELVPRDGDLLMVMSVCRISGCSKQKEASLEDQNDNAREEVVEHYVGSFQLDTIATKGKGEDLTRAEVQEIERLYRSRKYDLFVYDDLSRLVRGGEAARLLGVGVDHGTRSICIADGIDTADETWEEDALTACSENVAHNQRTSKRIKQKVMNRFKKYGETQDRGNPAYIVPEGARSYDDWIKNVAFEAIVIEGFRVLRATLNAETAADYFNRVGFPVGKFAKNKKWDGAMVLRFYRNTVLKGLPYRGRMATVKHHETGKRRSKKNPKGPKYYEAPHLAFFDTAEYDELMQLLAAKNGRVGRAAARKSVSRLGVPRKRTRGFGQHARCWYCGRHYVWGGNGVTGNLMCNGPRKWNCWNSIGFSGELAIAKVVEVVESRLSQLEGINEQFQAMVLHAQHGGHGSLAASWAKQHADEATLEIDREQLKQVVLKGGREFALITEMLADMERREVCIKANRRRLELADQSALRIPESTLEVRDVLARQLHELAVDYMEFGDFIREIVPEMHVYLVRLCDGGHLLPRAKVRLDMLGGWPDAKLTPELQALLSFEVTLDLFEPPERELIRTEAVRLDSQGLEQREIAARLPGGSTQTAVWKALRLQRQMESLDLSTPLQLVESPPDDYPKLRRHKNPKYRFEPLDGYVPPTI